MSSPSSRACDSGGRCSPPAAVWSRPECSWLCADPPSEAAAFFAAGYPGMADIAGNLERARAAGFDVIDQFTVPPAAWWEEFYTPLEERMAQLARGADPALAAMIDETRREIALYRLHGDSYGYVFYLLRRRSDAD
jgi:hypothetical protein